jgi:hypothetical protein
MWQVIIKIVEKLACRHEWEIIHQVEYEKTDQWGRVMPQTRLLMVCKHCGKIKKVKI